MRSSRNSINAAEAQTAIVYCERLHLELKKSFLYRKLKSLAQKLLLLILRKSFCRTFFWVYPTFRPHCAHHNIIQQTNILNSFFKCRPLPPFPPTLRKRDAANDYLKYLITVKGCSTSPGATLYLGSGDIINSLALPVEA